MTLKAETLIILAEKFTATSISSRLKEANSKLVDKIDIMNKILMNSDQKEDIDKRQAVAALNYKN